MFRKVLLLAVIAVFVFTAQGKAAQVSIESAKEAAQGFLIVIDRQFRAEVVEGPKPRIEPKGYQVVSVTPFTDAETKEVLAYIAHLSPQGFIVLSTDTEINPVISYSLHSNFVGEDNPRNTFCWILKKDMKQRHSKLKTINASLQRKNERKWSTYLGKAAEAPATIQVVTSGTGEDAAPLDEPLAITQWPDGDDTGWLNTTWGRAARRAARGSLGEAFEGLVEPRIWRQVDWLGQSDAAIEPALRSLGLEPTEALVALVSAARRLSIIRRHDFRSSFATHMLAAGVSGPLVQEFLGHSSYSTTQKHYKGDLSPALREAISRLQG